MVERYRIFAFTTFYRADSLASPAFGGVAINAPLYYSSVTSSTPFDYV